MKECGSTGNSYRKLTNLLSSQYHEIPTNHRNIHINCNQTETKALLSKAKHQTRGGHPTEDT